MTVEALLRRAPTAAVFGPRDDPTFRAALAAHLRSLGFATYELAMGPTARDALHAARATPPDTALVFVEYAPRAYHLIALLAAVLRWKAQGRFVAICRGPGAFASAKQRLAYAAVRALADLELPAREPAVLVGTWPRAHLPRPSWLAGVWPRRRADTPLAALLPILRCPECRGTLARDDAGLRCGSCGRVHPIVEGIPILVPDGGRRAGRGGRARLRRGRRVRLRRGGEPRVARDRPLEARPRRRAPPPSRAPREHRCGLR